MGNSRTLGGFCRRKQRLREDTGPGGLPKGNRDRGRIWETQGLWEDFAKGDNDLGGYGAWGISQKIRVGAKSLIGAIIWRGNQQLERDPVEEIIWEECLTVATKSTVRAIIWKENQELDQSPQLVE